MLCFFLSLHISPSFFLLYTARTLNVFFVIFFFSLLSRRIGSFVRFHYTRFFLEFFVYRFGASTFTLCLHNVAAFFIIIGYSVIIQHNDHCVFQ